MRLDLFEKNLDEEMYEMRVCKRGHCGPNGKNVRKYGAQCWACGCGLPNGPFTQIFTNIIPRRIPKSESLTDEEKAKLRSEASSRWNKRNRDKVKKYIAKYGNKPERKAITSQNHKIKYAALSQEEKDKLNERSKAWYHKNSSKEAKRLKAEGELENDIIK